MKYLALDIGDVLCNCYEDKFLSALSKSFNLSLEDSSRFFKRFWELHDLGYTTMEDELRDKLNVKSEIIIKETIDIWNSTIVPNTLSIDFFSNLQKEFDLNVAVLSNIGVEHVSQLPVKLSRNGFYDNIIKHFSCDVGVRKPSILFYQSFLMLHPEFKNCVYIDDRQDNLNTAKKLGFQSFRFNLKDYIVKDADIVKFDKLKIIDDLTNITSSLRT